MDVIFLPCAFVGVALFFYRMWPRHRFVSKSIHTGKKVSIIVPARNEEQNLPALLTSLKETIYPDFEIIVVDDQSTDGTAAVGNKFGIRVVKGKPKPLGWSGKQWACHQGALHAQGEYVLFTDADTKHAPRGVRSAVSFMEERRLDMMSTMPYHDCQTYWEKLLGPFHLLLLAVSAPYNGPKNGKVFVIGQFLMFTKLGYKKLGGHEAVKTRYVEDVPMANLAIRKGLRYEVLHGQQLFSVRMYDSLGDFMRGWRRNFRVGLTSSSKLAPLEMTLMICGMSGAAQWANPLAWLSIASVIMFSIWRQRHLGRFSPLGPVLFPISLMFFVVATLQAAFDELLGKKLIWKDRQYADQR